MSRIHQLDSSVVNKIAAGEVIERPANVVKELLENSLDALASRIEIDIEAGGGELIRIVDDGEGIHSDDLLLAVTAHATSKIATADDLFRVQTMGFRGEALASIAEVSRMRIRSRRPDLAGDTNPTRERGRATEDSSLARRVSLTGYEILSDCGRITPPQPCGCPVGTQIEVRQLFANTPVRRKFLKSVGTEFAHIAEHFSRIALAQPRLHLVLRHNGKVVFELPGTQQLLDRIRLLLGNELADNLIPVESESQGVRMWGYVAHPSVSKSTRKSQHLFLNGRWIQDRSLQHALTEAYRGLLMIGRQPIAFLFLEVPADIVDVNVHPTKTEVRFADGQALFRQLLSMLRTKFLSLNFESPMNLPGGGGFSQAGAAPRPRGVELQAWSPMNATNFGTDLLLSLWLLVAVSGCEHAAAPDANPPLPLAPPLSESEDDAKPQVVRTPKPDEGRHDSADLPDDPVERAKALKRQLPPRTPGGKSIGPGNSKPSTAAERLTEDGAASNLIDTPTLQALSGLVDPAAKSGPATPEPDLVKLKFVGRILHKPPLRSLLFDVTLHNPRAETCCYLLPAYMSEPPTMETDGVKTLEIVSLNAKVIFGEVHGNDRFQAVCVPPHSDLVLQRMPIKSFGEPTKRPISIEVVLARTLSIDQRPAERWYESLKRPVNTIEVVAKDGSRVGLDSALEPHTFVAKVSEPQRLKLQVDLAADENE